MILLNAFVRNLIAGHSLLSSSNFSEFWTEARADLNSGYAEMELVSSILGPRNRRAHPATGA